jgi:hypothetical protein
MLRSEEYEMPGISVKTADSIEGLAAEIDIDSESLTREECAALGYKGCPAASARHHREARVGIDVKMRILWTA